MGVTAIKAVHNMYEQKISVYNKEQDRNWTVEPNGWSENLDIWIPWARSSEEFEKHYMSIDGVADPIQSNPPRPRPPVTVYIWQYSGRDGDYVRWSYGAWSADAYSVPGYSEVDGNRVVVIDSDGQFYFQKISS